MTMWRTAIGMTVVLTTSTLQAQGLVGVGTNTISVTGEAEVRVVPDEVMLNLGVETFDKVLAVAKSANDQRIAKTVALVRAAGIPAEHVQTDYISIEPRYVQGDIARDLAGYVVRKSVVVRLREIARFESLLTAALDAGVTHVHGIEFRSTDLRKHRDQARTLALTAAREKAAFLAGAAGTPLGRVLSISESGYGYWSSYGSGWGSRYGSAAQNVVQSFGGASLSTDATLAPGQISIRASVSATFALQ
jgi:uncharacterized protein YggE